MIQRLEKRKVIEVVNAVMELFKQRDFDRATAAAAMCVILDVLEEEGIQVSRLEFIPDREEPQ